MREEEEEGERKEDALTEHVPAQFQVDHRREEEEDARKRETPIGTILGPSWDCNALQSPLLVPLQYLAKTSAKTPAKTLVKIQDPTVPCNGPAMPCSPPFLPPRPSVPTPRSSLLTPHSPTPSPGSGPGGGGGRGIRAPRMAQDGSKRASGSPAWPPRSLNIAQNGSR